MTHPTQHGLTLYDGHWLRWAGTWLSRRNETLSDAERRAGTAILTTFVRTWKPGKEPIGHLHEIQRRAQARIAVVGPAAFADEVENAFAGRRIDVHLSCGAWPLCGAFPRGCKQQRRYGAEQSEAA